METLVEILNETPRDFPLERVHRVLEALAAEQGVTRRVSVILVDDATIRALNARDRGEDEPTDVLSYPLWEPEDTLVPATEQLGDVFISLDTAERQAALHGHDLAAEVVTLAAHGITHLQGYDHETEAAWQIFYQTQARALELYRAGR